MPPGRCVFSLNCIPMRRPALPHCWPRCRPTSTLPRPRCVMIRWQLSSVRKWPGWYRRARPVAPWHRCSPGQRQRCRHRLSKRNAAQDAAGHGRRSAYRAHAVGLASAESALACRNQDALQRLFRAGNAGSVHASGQSVGYLAAQMGAGRPLFPFSGSGPLQRDCQAARRETRRARSLYRRCHRKDAGGVGASRHQGRGQWQAQAHLQYLEQNAAKTAGFLPDV